jgi:hypothetical protein
MFFCYFYGYYHEAINIINLKTSIKLVLFFSVLCFICASCGRYEIMHHDRNELTKVSENFSDYKVYIHDKKHTYAVEKASLVPAGIKGNLIPITDPAKIAEIKNPSTPGLLRKHKHDLSLYTKTQVDSASTGVVLKKEDITDVAHAAHKGKFNAGLYVQIAAVAAVGMLIWVLVISSFGSFL